MIQYRRTTHDENGRFRFRRRSREIAHYDNIPDVTDGLVHAFNGGWMTLEEIISEMDKQYVQDLRRHFLTPASTVAEHLSVLAAEGYVAVRVTHEGICTEAMDGMVARVVDGKAQEFYGHDELDLDFSGWTDRKMSGWLDDNCAAWDMTRPLCTGFCAVAELSMGQDIKRIAEWGDTQSAAMKKLCETVSTNLRG
jgi:hypothetical protein